MNRTKRSRFGKKKAVRKNRTLRRRKGGDLTSIETLDAIKMLNINQSIEQETRECYAKNKTGNTGIFNFFRSGQTTNKVVYDQKKEDECESIKEKKKKCLNSEVDKLKNVSHKSEEIESKYEKCLDGALPLQALSQAEDLQKSPDTRRLGLRQDQLTIKIDSVDYILKSLCGNLPEHLSHLSHLPKLQCLDLKNRIIETEKEIGLGGFNKVYKLKNNLVFKMTQMGRNDIESLKSSIVSGARIQAFLSSGCNKICKVFDVGVEKNEKFGYSIMEPFETDLDDLLFNPEYTLTKYAMKKIFKDIFTGLHCIHKKGYIHRDIKPENIGINILKKPRFGELECEAKIFDFDFVIDKQFSNSNELVGTEGFQDPEVLKHEYNYNYHAKSDVYAVGVMLYLWFLTDENQTEKIEKWNRGDSHTYTYSDENDPRRYDHDRDLALYDLMDKCLKKEIEKRYSAEKALSHPWINDNGISKDLKQDPVTPDQFTNTAPNQSTQRKLWPFKLFQPTQPTQPTQDYQQLDKEYEFNKKYKQYINNHNLKGGKRRTNRRVMRRGERGNL